MANGPDAGAVSQPSSLVTITGSTASRTELLQPHYRHDPLTHSVSFNDIVPPVNPVTSVTLNKTDSEIRRLDSHGACHGRSRPVTCLRVVIKAESSSARSYCVPQGRRQRYEADVRPETGPRRDEVAIKAMAPGSCHCARSQAGIGLSNRCPRRQSEVRLAVSVTRDSSHTHSCRSQL